jgi:threonine dehydratase
LTAQGALAMLASMPASPALSFELIEAARARLAGKINHTPVLTSGTLDAQHAARLYFKCENFQKVGAFKARGATNAVFALPEALAQRGVATHSSGNHAAALARAARLRGIAAHVVMPESTPQAKRAAVARYGAHVTLCAPTLEARERTARAVLEATGATLVHPYDDLMVIAGQGTCALEFLEQVPTLELLLCPVGGGGLISGTACAARALRPGIRILGVEPAGADDAARSLHEGHLLPSLQPNTIADGLRGALSARTFAEVQRGVEDILTVSDAAIVRAMRTLWEVLKIVIEPSAAVPYAALLEHPERLKAERIGIILTGGNLDLESLPWSTAART